MAAQFIGFDECIPVKATKHAQGSIARRHKKGEQRVKCEKMCIVGECQAKNRGALFNRLQNPGDPVIQRQVSDATACSITHI